MNSCIKAAYGLMVSIMAMLLIAMSSAAGATDTAEKETFAVTRMGAGAITKDGTLWLWGNNYMGELGNGKSGGRETEFEKDIDSVSPIKATTNVVSMKKFVGYTMALKKDGTLWAWGWNNKGQLGDGTTNNRSRPRKILDEVAFFDDSVAIKTDGTLWVWGNHTANKKPKMVLGKVAKVSGTMALRLSGTLWDFSDSNNPIKVMDDVAFVHSTLDYKGEHDNTFVIKKDGSLWAWGLNSFGKLGDSTTIKREQPVKIMDDVASVVHDHNRTFAIKKDGSLWGWGYNSAGQVGDGSKKDRLTPKKILDNAATVYLHSSQTFCIKKDGTLWSWGWNYHGSLGDGTDKDRLRPVKIMGGVATMDSANLLYMALKTDGTLWAWGDNWLGKIGDGIGYYENDNLREFGTFQAHLSPIKILSDVVAFRTRALGGMALKKDGSLWSWGSNVYGQVGNGKIDKSEFEGAPIKILDGVKY